MRAGLAVQRIGENGAGGDQQQDYRDRIERIAAERVAQQPPHAALIFKFGGISRYRSLTHFFSS